MILLVGLLTGLLTAAEPATVPVIFPNGTVIHAEVAQTPKERANGLMNRKSLPPDHGMLFVFEKADLYFFWMKNTFITLDIIWISPDKRIVHIEEQVPPCRRDPCPVYGRRFKSLYVLEVNGGVAQKQGLSIGSSVQFDLSDRKP
jgi:uncharacterized membrane protein (UPF0127 family)